MSKKNDVSESDSNLFRKTVGKVEKIENGQVIHHQVRKPAIIPARQMRHTRLGNIDQRSSPISEISATDKLYFKRPGIQQKLMSKLSRGQFRIERQIDLHGMTAVVAEKSLNSFLESCRQSNYRCIRIIHGKGTGSTDNRPVIKNGINEWLRKNENVLAFCSAKANDGGTGAVYALLRTRE